VSNATPVVANVLTCNLYSPQNSLVLSCLLVCCRYDFFLQSPVLQGQMRYETEFDWGGTRIFVSTAIVEGLRCFFIEPRNSFFATPTVYGRYDDEVTQTRMLLSSTPHRFAWLASLELHIMCAEGIGLLQARCISAPPAYPYV